MKSDLNNGVLYLVDALLDAERVSPGGTDSTTFNQLLMSLVQPFFPEQRV